MLAPNLTQVISIGSIISKCHGIFWGKGKFRRGGGGGEGIQGGTPLCTSALIPGKKKLELQLDQLIYSDLVWLWP